MKELIATEADVIALIQRDDAMMSALHVAHNLNLPGWRIGAGFLRNKVWDAMSGVKSTVASDVDLVYFNKADTAAETDWEYDRQLKQMDPHNEWEVRNQARMHYVNGFEPFTSTEDGIAHWTETATAVGVKLEGGELRLLFCYGTEDLFGMISRPTPYIQGDRIDIFNNRMAKKNWQERWPKLQIKR